jgi:hypothetical protein
MQRIKMEESGIDDDKLEQATTVMKKYFMIFLVLGSYSALLFGAVLLH